ncbi:flagellar export chaperone FlgN [Sporanaerobacter sp. PP17-6a]|jgi:hypothetical protein|uniref:flagellar export chaperone FlgN n=1 Tax=Sporanaerobacter sp. PP17-6a TaxID=1891289 RepID=UPI0008A00AF9|nr:flagellar export chaperone FlgN [Sporanaerobacter sp. PP17-6a]MBE6083128.1 hypothetical protein [Tissierellaceae bacterium]SCL87504.1 FlgN protein [Sporanaerobacter sp. PP17-6a]
MKEDLVSELIEISEKKLGLLDEMLLLTKKQRTVISQEKQGNLNEIIDKKDKIIDEIDKLDKIFILKFSRYKLENKVESIDKIDVRDKPELKNLKDVITKITSTLMAISIIDKENNLEIKDKLEDVKENLKKVKDGYRAYKGYNKKVKGSILIDEKR